MAAAFCGLFSRGAAMRPCDSPGGFYQQRPGQLLMVAGLFSDTWITMVGVIIFSAAQS